MKYCVDFSLQSFSVLHVMTLIKHNSIRTLKDYSFDKVVSRPLQNLVKWIPDSNTEIMTNYWQYRYIS